MRANKKRTAVNTASAKISELATQRGFARARWEEHVEAWRESGLTQAGYCRDKGLRAKYLSRWNKKLQEPLSPGQPASHSPQAVFTTMTLGQPAGSVQQQSSIIIALPSGLRIEVWPHFDENTLQRLLAVVR